MPARQVRKQHDRASGFGASFGRRPSSRRSGTLAGHRESQSQRATKGGRWKSSSCSWGGRSRHHHQLPVLGRSDDRSRDAFDELPSRKDRRGGGRAGRGGSKAASIAHDRCTGTGPSRFASPYLDTAERRLRPAAPVLDGHAVLDTDDLKSLTTHLPNRAQADTPAATDADRITALIPTVAIRPPPLIAGAESPVARGSGAPLLIRRIAV